MTGAELKQLRERLGWSQVALADALGTTQPAVSQWERGRSPVPGPVAKLARRIERDYWRRAAGV